MDSRRRNLSASFIHILTLSEKILNMTVTEAQAEHVRRGCDMDDVERKEQQSINASERTNDEAGSMNIFAFSPICIAGLSFHGLSKKVIRFGDRSRRSSES